MTIDIYNPYQGHHFCISREQADRPRQVGDIWVAPDDDTGSQMFESIQKLYCPTGTKADDDLPFVTYVHYK
jgi:hypothetical protein